MIFKIKTKGHKNISSLHKSTFEITKDKEITPSGDCIIGVSSNYVLDDFPNDLKKEIANSNTKIIVILETENASDKIIGWVMKTYLYHIQLILFAVKVIILVLEL